MGQKGFQILKLKNYMDGVGKSMLEMNLFRYQNIITCPYL